jgi:ribosome-associated heat shock protein Hsp15
MESDNDKVRLDKWLWAARFFKTRSLAAEAVTGGKVHINGNRAKPSHSVRIGEQMQIRKGPYEFQIIVRNVSARRGSAQTAAVLYEEIPASRAARELLAEQHRLAAITSPRSEGRPDKKQRRQIIRFTGKEK